MSPVCSFELLRRPQDLGGGWLVRLHKDGAQVFEAIYPQGQQARQQALELGEDWATWGRAYGAL